MLPRHLAVAYLFLLRSYYVTKEEVRRVCSTIDIRDWTALTDSKVKIEEAAVIRKLVGGEALAISSEDFRDGLEVELEHGLAFPDANVTNNHPILTGKIVLAHLKETLDYYVRLRVAESEGDMLKALIAIERRTRRCSETSAEPSFPVMRTKASCERCRPLHTRLHW